MKLLAVCVPLSWDSVPVKFLLSWTGIAMRTARTHEVLLLTARSPYLHRMRDDLASEALKHSPDYILWLDADQVYPPDTAKRLMEHVDSGKLVVGGVTPQRVTGQPMIYDFSKAGGYRVNYRTEFEAEHGVHEIGGMGFGGVMMHPSVFKKLSQPYFWIRPDERPGVLPGEDIIFFRKCRDAGIKVWCDYDLRFTHCVSLELRLPWK